MQTYGDPEYVSKKRLASQQCEEVILSPGFGWIYYCNNMHLIDTRLSVNGPIASTSYHLSQLGLKASATL